MTDLDLHALLGELLGEPLRPDLRERVREARKSIDCDLSAVPARLVEHVEAGATSIAAALWQVRMRRKWRVCEWCGSAPPDDLDGLVLTCSTCRVTHAAELRGIEGGR